MAFDFPASPADGTRFTPAGGPTYVFSNGVWKIEGSIGAPGNLSMGDLPPPNPQNGQMWWESDTGNLFAWFDDGDSAQWVQINVPNVTGLATSQARNRIGNPAMQIAQDGIAPITTTGYVIDQWIAAVGGFTFSASKTTAAAHQIGMAVTTGKAPAAGEYMTFSQLIEGLKVWDFSYGTAGALPSVLRFDVYCAVPGTYAASLRNGVYNRSLILPFTITTANVWTTIVLPVPGDTAGTWVVDNTSGLVLAIAFACGTTYQTSVAGWQAGNFMAPAGMTNGYATTGNWNYIKNVGLYLDPDNTGLPPRWEMPDQAQELIACQRYYEIMSGAVAATIWHTINYVPKRIGPAITASFAGTSIGGLGLAASHVSNAGTSGCTYTINARL